MIPWGIEFAAGPTLDSRRMSVDWRVDREILRFIAVLCDSNSSNDQVLTGRRSSVYVNDYREWPHFVVCLITGLFYGVRILTSIEVQAR